MSRAKIANVLRLIKAGSFHGGLCRNHFYYNDVRLLELQVLPKEVANFFPLWYRMIVREV